MMELLSYGFMRNALISALLVSVICGVLGPIAVIRRNVMTVGGIAHGAYGGLGLAWFLGYPPRPFAYLAAVILACLAVGLSKKAQKRADSVMGILWALGMAFGVILTDLTPGYDAELTSYLFGSIMTVSKGDLALMGSLGVLALALAWLCYSYLEAYLFDKVFAYTRGVPVEFLDWAVTVLTALAVVAMIRIVGLIMVMALFTMPSFVAEKRAKSLGSMMAVSSGLALGFSVTGLWLSSCFDLTAGAAIVAVGGAVCFLDGLKEILLPTGDVF